MKLAIKILLIVLVVAGIAYIAITQFGSMEDTPPPPVPELTKFEKHIQKRVENEVADCSYDEATKAFNSIMDEITTEANIMVERDGEEEPSISDEEAQSCREELFYAYAPIFTAHTDEYFQRSTWDEAYINQLRDKAKEMQQAHIAEEGTATTEKLAATIKTVDDYHAALKVVRQAEGCTTVAAAKSIISEAQAYQRAPLTNCDRLRSQLAQVPTKAKNAVATVIRNRCADVINKFDNIKYGSFREANDAINSCTSAITDYYNAFGRGAFDAELKKFSDRKKYMSNVYL